MLQSVRGLREESGYYFPRKFDAKFDFYCVFTTYTFSRSCSSTEVNSISHDSFSRV